MTDEVTDGLILHTHINGILTEYGFFGQMDAEKKAEFNAKMEEVIGRFLAYDEEKSTGCCNGCGRAHPDIVYDHFVERG
jgi:hypothetical protein